MASAVAFLASERKALDAGFVGLDDRLVPLPSVRAFQCVTVPALLARIRIVGPDAGSAAWDQSQGLQSENQQMSGPPLAAT